ncbi:MAG: hypothetical protein ACQSGP_21205 [Frankia sp.]
MPKGILYVESRPSSPEEAAEYHKWYENVHIPEVLAVEGFVSARRFALTDDGPFIAIYEIEADDLEAVQARLLEASKTGAMSPPVATQSDPPPIFRFLRQIAEYAP